MTSMNEPLPEQPIDPGPDGPWGADVALFVALACGMAGWVLLTQVYGLQVAEVLRWL